MLLRPSSVQHTLGATGTVPYSSDTPPAESANAPRANAPAERPLAFPAIDVLSLLARKLPPRELLLDPWLRTKGLVMIHAWRGVGKTFVGLGILFALWTGGQFLRWKASRPCRVLLIDGEMPAELLQDRLRQLVGDDDRDIVVQSASFQVIAADMLDGGAPDLSDPQQQAELQRVIDLLDPDVIICDNIATLVRSEQSESDDQSWVEAQAWSLAMRRQGRAVIWIHHSNKGGSQRGTSKREDVLDVVINLRRPSDYKPEQGARFEVHFEKARGVFGDNVESFEAWLKPDESGRSRWHVNGLSSLRDRIRELDAQGVLHAEIARKLGCNPGTVSKYVGKSAKAATPKSSRRAKRQRNA